MGVHIAGVVGASDGPVSAFGWLVTWTTGSACLLLTSVAGAVCTGGQVPCPSLPSDHCSRSGDDARGVPLKQQFLTPHGNASVGAEPCPSTSNCTDSVVVPCSTLTQEQCQFVESCHWSVSQGSTAEGSNSKVAGAASALGVVGVVLALTVVFLGVGTCFMGHLRRCREGRRHAPPVTRTPDGSVSCIVEAPSAGIQEHPASPRPYNEQMCGTAKAECTRG